MNVRLLSRVSYFLSMLCLPLVTQAQNFQQVVDDAYEKFKSVTEGANADYIPALEKVPSDLFAVVLITRFGETFVAGDADYTFSIQSIAKPFTAGLVMHESGIQTLIDKIGVEPTGLPFNSKLAIELLETRSANPLVNAGAIAAVSLVQAQTEAERWKTVHNNLNAFAGSKLTLLNDVYQSEYDTAWSNRAIANLLFNYERLYSAPEEALRVYTQQGSLGVNTKQLAMMGATLANRGLNPKTEQQVIHPDTIDELLAIMMSAGFYDESGLWAVKAGLPAKTGVGGGIVAVVPGKLAIAAFSPRLNAAGNSIRAMGAIEHISNTLGLSLFLPPKRPKTQVLGIAEPAQAAPSPTPAAQALP